MEMLVRRLLGVHTADQTGNWKVCSALSLAGYGNSLVPTDVLKSIAIELSQLEKLETRQHKLSRGQGRKFYQDPEEAEPKRRFDKASRAKSRSPTASGAKPSPPGGLKSQAGADKTLVGADQQ